MEERSHGRRSDDEGSSVFAGRENARVPEHTLHVPKAHNAIHEAT